MPAPPPTAPPHHHTRPGPKDVPIGGEEVSKQVALVGQKREFDFPVKDHLQLGEELDLIDFETGGVVRGWGWAVCVLFSYFVLLACVQAAVGAGVEPL